MRTHVECAHHRNDELWELCNKYRYGCTLCELRSAFMYDSKCSTTFAWCTINAPATFAWCTINVPAVFAWCTNQFVHKVEFSYIDRNGVHTLWVDYLHDKKTPKTKQNKTKKQQQRNQHKTWDKRNQYWGDGKNKQLHLHKMLWLLIHALTSTVV